MDRADRRELSLAFLPWVIFAVVGRNVGEGTAWASVGALLTVLVVSFPSHSRHPFKSLERCAIALFSALLVVGVIAGPERTAVVNHYGRVFAFGGLALIAIVSLFLVPFTEDYTRESVRERYWHTPAFLRTNFQITAVAAVAFTLMTASLVAGQIYTTSLQNTFLNWIVPITLAFAASKVAGSWWREYFENHVPAADENREQISVLDTLFLDSDRRAG